eukprot:354399-Chlamydomonas_euryale.AAC.8
MSAGSFLSSTGVEKSCKNIMPSFQNLTRVASTSCVCARRISHVDVYCKARGLGWLLHHTTSTRCASDCDPQGISLSVSNRATRASPAFTPRLAQLHLGCPLRPSYRYGNLFGVLIDASAQAGGCMLAAPATRAVVLLLCGLRCERRRLWGGAYA